MPSYGKACVLLRHRTAESCVKEERTEEVKKKQKVAVLTGMEQAAERKQDKPQTPGEE